MSVIREPKIVVKELEDQIEKLTYSGESKPKDFKVEHTKFPPFIQAFYYLFFASLKIPSETEFLQTYLNSFGKIEHNNFIFNGEVFELEGLKNRILRTYPSLIRDLHFVYLLIESARFDQVTYSMRTDYIDGLDIKISYLNVDYFISLFINTSRAQFYKREKENRHDYAGIKQVEFSVDRSSLKKCGQILLLTETHIDSLILTLKSL
ncbi:hypothetical protein J2X69_000604 [Algoriphagus sp. 4150]|uniref:hypothetical protein n=1 Tax=Algoriphagus sp. 4150 TaxID=2817756 RepID=UPI00285F82C6|nr:hypothetical protein [Algoriphagus sp. 4150]MDR7128276.1 hypothetical protein [Algoriphagus sp. 4150]